MSWADWLNSTWRLSILTDTENESTASQVHANHLKFHRSLKTNLAWRGITIMTYPTKSWAHWINVKQRRLAKSGLAFWRCSVVSKRFCKKRGAICWCWWNHLSSLVVGDYLYTFLQEWLSNGWRPIFRMCRHMQYTLTWVYRDARPPRVQNTSFLKRAGRFLFLWQGRSFEMTKCRHTIHHPCVVAFSLPFSLFHWSQSTFLHRAYI